MTSLRLAFLGTPAFAVPMLEALLTGGYDIAAVYTQPPRPAGRGQKPQPTPIQHLAEAHGIEVRMPENLRAASEQDAFRALALDAAIVVAYGLILPKPILAAPRFGCFNLHASLLPRWRGAAPIQRAIMAGDTESGVMVMRMEEGLDTGPILAEWRTPITDETTAGMLYDLLSREGARLMLETLPQIAAGTAHERLQPGGGHTYANKITPEEASIDWARPAAQILRHINGLNPTPCAWTMLGPTRLKIMRARLVDAKGRAGEIVDAHLTVACGSGAIQITELQRAGKAPQSAQAFLRGFDLPKDARLG